MNFLGHLYFSGDNHALMIANLYGDFVKGKDYSYLPPIVQDGVKLHREIDDFIDRHPAISSLRSELYNDLPKIAGIAIDLYMDHLLAKNWGLYSNQSLKLFIDNFFSFALNTNNHFFKIENTTFKYPVEFIDLLKIMNKNNWIIRYKELEGLRMASTGLSKRISFPNNLDQATDVFINRERIITPVFQHFMKDALLRFHHIN